MLNLIVIIINRILLRVWFEAWFQISADSVIYRQYCIRFWGTWWDIIPIISANIGGDIAYIDTNNHWPIPIPMSRF